MQKLIILAVLVACSCCLAAPASEKIKDDALLQRPTPINPAIPSAPKPAERITKITDPKEIAKHKRETGTPNQPKPLILPATAQPKSEHAAARPSTEQDKQQHHREKRDHHQTPAPPKQVNRKNEQPAKGEKSRPKRDVSHLLVSQSAGTSSTLASVPTIYRDQAQAAAASDSATHQALPAIIHSSSETHPAAKRDIPVPLVAKHQQQSAEVASSNDKSKDTEKEQHASKEDKDEVQVEDLSEHPKQNKRENSGSSTTPATSTTTDHPAIRKYPVPVSELFANRKAPESTVAH